MKKILIILLTIILMSSVAFAAVTRSGSGTSVTYTSTMATSYSKAYWAVDEIVPAGCTVSSVSCTVTNGGCAYVGGAIRIVGYTSEAGGSMPSSIAVSVTGTGSCTLNNGNYVESYNDGTARLGSSTALTGSASLSFGSGCCTQEADTSSPCDNVITWNEFKTYLLAWAQGTQKCSHTITFSQFKTQLIYWSTN